MYDATKALHDYCICAVCYYVGLQKIGAYRERIKPLTGFFSETNRANKHPIQILHGVQLQQPRCHSYARQQNAYALCYTCIWGTSNSLTRALITCLA